MGEESGSICQQTVKAPRMPFREKVVQLHKNPLTLIMTTAKAAYLHIGMFAKPYDTK